MSIWLPVEPLDVETELLNGVVGVAEVGLVEGGDVFLVEVVGS